MLNAREFLELPKMIDRMIENKKTEMEQWITIAESTTVHSEGERVQSSGSQQKMADAINIFIDLEREVAEEMIQLAAIKRDVIHVIQQLKVNEYDVLHKMYIGVMVKIKTPDGIKKITEYRSLEQVADMCGKSRSWAKDNHRSGLVKVQRMLDSNPELSKSAEKRLKVSKIVHQNLNDL